MRITAQTENNAQEIIRFTTQHESYGGYWSAVRLVGWITQNTTQKTTTLYFKWQRTCEKNNPYWNTAHDYTVSLAGVSKTSRFALGKASTTWVDVSPTQNITVSHDAQGAFSGTLSASGYKYWESASGTATVEFPTITDSPSPTPTPEPDPPTPIPTNNDPYYYIYADETLLYANGFEDSEGNRPYQIIRPKLVLEVNKSGSLTFDIPVTNERYEDLAKLKTNIECRQGNEVLFRGRIINDRRNFYNTKTVYCEGFLSFLFDSVVKPFVFEGSARDLFSQIITGHNAQVTSDRQITFTYSDITKTLKTEQTGYEKSFKCIQDNLLNVIGGYLVPYYSTPTGIQYLSSYKRETSQVIQFGENLTDFEEFIDASQVFTAVMPIGKDGLTISGDYVEDPTAVSAFGRIIEVVEFPDITSVSELEASARTYLRQGIESATTIKISAVDLHLLDRTVEKIRLGDTVRCVSAPHSLDALFMCTRIEIDMEDASNTVYTFGAIPKGITDLQTSSAVSRYVITE